VKDFLESYKNLRDYQKVFRLLTERGGEIQIKDDIMYAKLDAWVERHSVEDTRNFLTNLKIKNYRWQVYFAF